MFKVIGCINFKKLIKDHIITFVQYEKCCKYYDYGHQITDISKSASSNTFSSYDLENDKIYIKSWSDYLKYVKVNEYEMRIAQKIQNGEDKEIDGIGRIVNVKHGTVHEG